MLQQQLVSHARTDAISWKTKTVVEKRHASVEWYRRKFGKAEGEARFFAQNDPFERVAVDGNLLMYLGASNLWGCLSGSGTGTAGQNLTYFNNANAYVWVGDGAYSSNALTGTASATNNSTSITTTSSQSSLIGEYLVFLGDATNGIYQVASGSGTAWTLATPYGGSTASGLTFYKVSGEKPNQTALAATTNVEKQVADAGYPSYVDGNTPLAISAASNATPIVITTPTHSWSTGDFVHIQGVLGNVAANGLWQITVLSSTTFSLNGSVGSGAYTSGGYASKNNVFLTQATFDNAHANFWWYEWALRNSNSTGTGRQFNRKVVGLGFKTSAASWTFRNAIALA